MPVPADGAVLTDGAAPPAPGPGPEPGIVTERLQKRSDFLRLNRGRREATSGFVLLGRDRRDGSETVRVGFTCSKKVGGAVQRNRAKRRLREVVRLDLPCHGRPGWDYVLIGRRDSTAALPFEALRNDFTRALARLHGQKREHRP